MQQILRFLKLIREEKNQVFQTKIEKYESESNSKRWNGATLKIENQEDVFLYISEDQKTIKTSLEEFDPKIPFSYLVYLSYYHHIAEYVNGGLEFVGFYNSDYEKINEIPFGSIKIIGCEGGCSFEDKKNPIFRFELQQTDGNTHTSFRGNPHSVKTCQGVIDCIWQLEDFYGEWWDVYVHSPKSLM